MSTYRHPKDLSFHPPVRGRGAGANPSGRFENREMVSDAETYNALIEADEEQPHHQVPTQIYEDASRSIVTRHDSPDIGMEVTLNPYRGCEHGCIYCFARPTHEYLGLSAGIDFETKIFVKRNAAELLREKLMSPQWHPQIITLSGITDCYQPLERKLEITRACFSVLCDFANPGTVITKNHLVTRDIDIFREMAQSNTIKINISLTTLDTKLARIMEPRTSTPPMRLKAITALREAGVPVGIMMGPVVPGLTEAEIPALLKAAADAGAQSASYTMLRLPYGVKNLFQEWLSRHYPDRAEKILNRLRDMHDGKLYDSRFGHRMRGSGVYADHVAALFALHKKKYRLTQPLTLSTANFKRPGDQMDLFSY
jgi:DNA repair photolyase